jgi:hypothetical protein
MHFKRRVASLRLTFLLPLGSKWEPSMRNLRIWPLKPLPCVTEGDCFSPPAIRPFALKPQVSARDLPPSSATVPRSPRSSLRFERSRKMFPARLREWTALPGSLYGAAWGCGGAANCRALGFLATLEKKAPTDALSEAVRRFRGQRGVHRLRRGSRNSVFWSKRLLWAILLPGCLNAHEQPAAGEMAVEFDSP